MKPIARITISLLSAVLVLLGFGGCKSCRKAAKDNDANIIRDTIRIIRPPEPQRDPTIHKVVYGPPPSMYRNDITK